MFAIYTWMAHCRFVEMLVASQGLTLFLHFHALCVSRATQLSLHGIVSNGLTGLFYLWPIHCYFRSRRITSSYADQFPRSLFLDIRYSVSISPIIDNNFKISPTSGRFSIVSTIRYSPRLFSFFAQASDISLEHVSKFFRSSRRIRWQCQQILQVVVCHAVVFPTMFLRSFRKKIQATLRALSSVFSHKYPELYHSW